MPLVSITPMPGTDFFQLHERAVVRLCCLKPIRATRARHWTSCRRRWPMRCGISGSLREDSKFGSLAPWHLPSKVYSILAPSAAGRVGLWPGQMKNLVQLRKASKLTIRSLYWSDGSGEEAFLACIDRLPEPQRAVVLLRVLQDFTLQEIAEISGDPARHVVNLGFTMPPGRLVGSFVSDPSPRMNAPREPIV